MILRTFPTSFSCFSLTEVAEVAAEGLQSIKGDVRAASEPLIGRLEAVAANLVKLELQHLSWDVLLLGQASKAAGEQICLRRLILKAKPQSSINQTQSKVRISRNANSCMSYSQAGRKFCLQEWKQNGSCFFTVCFAHEIKVLNVIFCFFFSFTLGTVSSL